MCTSIALFQGGGYFGRNLDLEYSFGEQVVIMPRLFPLHFHRLPSLDSHFSMIGMANVAIVSFLILMLIQIPDKSGALDAFAGWIVSRCKSIRSAELVAYFLAMSGCIATHSSTNTIVFFGPFVKQLMSDYKDEADPCRSANILDGVACGTNGLIPHGNPALVITGVATSVAGVPASFSFLNFIGYTFHCWGLLIIFLLSILTGIGRKRKKENVQSQG